MYQGVSRPSLDVRVGRLMADGRKRTVAHVASELGIDAECAREAIRRMLGRHNLRVAGREADPLAHNKPARLFVLGPVPVIPHPRPEHPRPDWPTADGVVLGAMDAMVRVKPT